MRTNHEKTIYLSKHLKIQFDKEYSLFIQEWVHGEPIPIIEFKSELIDFKKIFNKFLPKNIIWLQEDFTTDLKVDDHLWIEKNINEPCKTLGLEKLAFVVGKDVMAHLSVFNYFEDLKSCLSPKHFAGKIEAMNWILNVQKAANLHLTANKFEIKYLGQTDSGNSQYTIETDSDDTESTLKSFKHILQENEFLKQNAEKFYSLTQREKEVFDQYAKGILIKDIADNLFLSEFTVRTHWRNAKKKLSIKTLADISDYKNSFLK